MQTTNGVFPAAPSAPPLPPACSSPVGKHSFQDDHYCQYLRGCGNNLWLRWFEIQVGENSKPPPWNHQVAIAWYVPGKKPWEVPIWALNQSFYRRRNRTQQIIMRITQLERCWKRIRKSPSFVTFLPSHPLSALGRVKFPPRPIPSHAPVITTAHWSFNGWMGLNSMKNSR